MLTLCLNEFSANLWDMTMPMPLYRRMALTIYGRDNSTDFYSQIWGRELDVMVRNELPSGSGIDHGCTLDGTSATERIVVNVPFHHTDLKGYYGGWTEHQIIVTPSLINGFGIQVTGHDKNDIKETLNLLFREVFSSTGEV